MTSIEGIRRQLKVLKDKRHDSEDDFFLQFTEGNPPLPPGFKGTVLILGCECDDGL